MSDHIADASKMVSPQPAPHAMTDERAAFEREFSKPPFEWSFDRYGEQSAWPGHYQIMDVQCAWEAWQARAALAQPAAVEHAKPAINEEFLAFNTNTSKGGRDALKWYFANVLKRHDFQRYIETRIAVDFSCALSGHLQAISAPSPAVAEPANSYQAFLDTPSSDCLVPGHDVPEIPAHMIQQPAASDVRELCMEVAEAVYSNCIDGDWNWQNERPLNEIVDEILQSTPAVHAKEQP